MQTGMDRLEQFLEKQPKDFVEGETSLLSEVAYERLLDAIRHAGLRPGDPLSKNRISQAMGLSRTPVSDAIQRLSSEGLLQIVPGRMIAIAAPSIHEVMDAVYIRLQLEPKMVYLIAGRLEEPVQTKLLSIVEHMEKAAQSSDRVAWAQADTKYHELLSDHCPNKFLGRIVLEARNRVLPTISDGHSNNQYVIDGTARHRSIAEAIIAGQAEKAETLEKEHIEQIRQNMLERIVQH